MRGKSSKAYQLLEPAEAVRAGDSDYDFPSAWQRWMSGRIPGRFALERVLAMDPNNVHARAEIARAYLALGETGDRYSRVCNSQETGAC